MTKIKLSIFNVLILTILTISPVYSTQTPTEFFHKYINYANNYNSELLRMYSPNAKISRKVIKPNGEVVTIIIPTKRFFKELKIGQKTAKLKKYKNQYRNITVTELQNGIKISAERQPINENYWLKMYQIVQETDSGYIIKEEMMQTKVQSFLKHKSKVNDE